jgi:hypothetical protein
MGRPLKIQKIISTANPGVDNGYPNFGSLTAPVVNTADTLNSDQFLGVVGGSNTVDTATFPTVKCRVFVTGIAAEEDGYILRQKGAHKYLVGGITARTALISGNAYRITVVGDTAWNEYGLVGTAAVGAVFTATATLADTGTGRVNAVGVCILSSEADATLTEGNMNITYTLGDSTAVQLSKLTNKFVRDWTNFANEDGTAISSYASGGDNTGVVDYSGEAVEIANFFTDEGTVQKSGAQDATNGTAQGTGTFFNATGGVELVIVENYNS